MTSAQTRTQAGRPTPTRTRPPTATGSRTPPPPGRTPVDQPPPRLGPGGSFRLTGRGAIVALFMVSFLGLLGASWTGWSVPAYAAFVGGCGVVTYYTKAGSLRTIVVSPPLIFLTGCVCAEAVTSSGKFAIAEGLLYTLGTSAPWLFTGTALVVVIALGRGFRPSIPLLTRRHR